MSARLGSFLKMWRSYRALRRSCYSERFEFIFIDSTGFFFFFEMNKIRLDRVESDSRIEQGDYKQSRDIWLQDGCKVYNNYNKW